MEDKQGQATEAVGGEALAALGQKYGDGSPTARLQRAQQVLAASFALTTAGQARLGPGVYARLAAMYEDACEVFGADGPAAPAAQKLLYTIYDAYFGALAGLPWAQRRAVKADYYTRQMRLAVKKGGAQSASARYWVQFAKLALPTLAVAFGGEFLLLWLVDTPAPFWLLALCALAFAGGFAAYIYVCYHLEGRRLHGDLQRWLRYRTAPEEHSRPLDIIQTGKLLLPLLIAVASALVKQYLK